MVLVFLPWRVEASFGALLWRTVDPRNLKANRTGLLTPETPLALRVVYLKGTINKIPFKHRTWTEPLWNTLNDDKILMFRHKTCSRRIASRRGKVRKDKVEVSAAGSLSCPLSFLSLIIWDIISSPAVIWTSEASYWSFRPLIEHGFGGNPLFVINSYARRNLIRSLSFSQTK